MVQLEARYSSLKLLLTQDPCRGPVFGMTANGFNYQWLDGLLRTGFESAGWSVSLAAPIAAGGGFDAEPVAVALSLKRDPAGWASLSGIRDDTPQAETLDRVLDAQLGEPWPDLLIGYELPPWLARWAHRRQIPFASIGPAAQRFLPDLLVELQTSSVALAGVAARLAVDQAELDHAAARFGATRRARHHLPLFDSGRLGLVVGQMAVDASLISDGRFARLDDHIDRIRDLADGLDAVLISPHPYETDRTPLHRLADALPRACLTTIGTYDLLSAASVTDVISLSSSVLTEAPLFGARAHRLIESDRSRCYAALGHEASVLSLDQLQRALAAFVRGDHDVATPGNVIPTVGAPFREAIDHQWGLDHVSLPSQLRIGETLQARHTDMPDSLSAASLVANWWGADGHYNWSSAEEAVLHLRANHCAGRTLLVRLCVPAHATGPVTITLCAGSSETRAEMLPGTEQVLALAITQDMLLGGTLLDVRLRCGRLTRPDVENPDRRALGLGLRDIAIVPEEVGSQGSASC